ncbi:unnamed protein product [Prorocentrum cordatum]|uniref:RRM domain-containing protein n=1 Tax=Prorocentrum cordatum TaxID=2364126 RepID=A0ABN9U2N6_9DINO|nr:unnamed protein product [Polarella glacialis]
MAEEKADMQRQMSESRAECERMFSERAQMAKQLAEFRAECECRMTEEKADMTSKMAEFRAACEVKIVEEKMAMEHQLAEARRHTEVQLSSERQITDHIRHAMRELPPLQAAMELGDLGLLEVELRKWKPESLPDRFGESKGVVEAVVKLARERLVTWRGVEHTMKEVLKEVSRLPGSLPALADHCHKIFRALKEAQLTKMDLRRTDPVTMDRIGEIFLAWSERAMSHPNGVHRAIIRKVVTCSNLGPFDFVDLDICLRLVDRASLGSEAFLSRARALVEDENNSPKDLRPLLSHVETMLFFLKYTTREDLRLTHAEFRKQAGRLDRHVASHLAMAERQYPAGAELVRFSEGQGLLDHAEVSAVLEEIRGHPARHRQDSLGIFREIFYQWALVMQHKFDLLVLPHHTQAARSGGAAAAMDAVEKKVGQTLDEIWSDRLAEARAKRKAAGGGSGAGAGRGRKAAGAVRKGAGRGVKKAITAKKAPGRGKGKGAAGKGSRRAVGREPDAPPRAKGKSSGKGKADGRTSARSLGRAARSFLGVRRSISGVAGGATRLTVIEARGEAKPAQRKKRYWEVEVDMGKGSGADRGRMALANGDAGKGRSGKSKGRTARRLASEEAWDLDERWGRGGPKGRAKGGAKGWAKGWAKAKGGAKGGTKGWAKGGAKRAVFFENADFYTTTSTLLEHFERAGPVAKFTLYTLPNGKSRGMGVCEYKTAASAERAIWRLDGAEVDGWPLQVVCLLVFRCFLEARLTGADPHALIAQVGTGEGKSMIIAALAIYVAVVLRKKVHIVVDDETLLERDFATFKPLFDAFELPLDGHNGQKRRITSVLCVSEDRLASSRKDPSFAARVDPDADICYCEAKHVQSFYASIARGRGDFGTYEDRVLILDEVDALIIDEEPNEAFVYPNQELSQMATRVAQALKGGASPEQLHGMWTGPQQHPAAARVVREMISEWARGSQMQASDDFVYVKESGRYCALQAGRANPKTWSLALECRNFQEGLSHEILYQERLFVMSRPRVFRKYHRILGLSGSMGTEAERRFLESTYRASFFEVPPFLKTCRGSPFHEATPVALGSGRRPVYVEPTPDAQLARLAEVAFEARESVPVLVIAKDRAQCDQLVERLRQAARSRGYGSAADDMVRSLSRTLCESDPEQWKENLNRSTLPLGDGRGASHGGSWRVTVTDPRGGRGTDYRVDDPGVDGRGGLLLIPTIVPTSQREWIQFLGRTARQDRRGQFCTVLCETDYRGLSARFGQTLPVGNGLEAVEV